MIKITEEQAREMINLIWYRGENIHGSMYREILKETLYMWRYAGFIEKPPIDYSKYIGKPCYIGHDEEMLNNNIRDGRLFILVDYDLKNGMFETALGNYSHCMPFDEVQDE